MLLKKLTIVLSLHLLQNTNFPAGILKPTVPVKAIIITKNSAVTDMSYMFCNCYALAKLDLCSFDTSRLAGADCNDGYFTKK